MSRVLSVNLGRPRMQRLPQGRATGIHKQPVDVITVGDPGPKRVVDGAGVSGVGGDHVGDGRHHGGSDQAVYAFAREELDTWGRVLGRELPHGMFGENLTTTGLDVDAAEVAHARTGAYLQVITPGELRSGDRIEVQRSRSGLDVPTVLRAFTGDRSAARAALESGALAEPRRTELLARLG